MDDSYENVISNLNSKNQNEPQQFMSDNSVEDIYQQDDEEIEPQFEPQNLLNRRNTNEIEQTCTNVRNFVIKSSTNKNSMTPNPIKKLMGLTWIQHVYHTNNEDITDQIIAMGFPADDIERYYRNSMQDVQRFFNTRHSGHYKVINLCSERKYKHSCFNNMVAEFPFEDHQAPTMDLLYSLCQELDEWLNKDKSNIAAIHCKAGKGRTGVMICCYLLYCKMFDNSYDAMRYYGCMRTYNAKGVTIPSQIRYIIYFETCLHNGWTLKDIPVTPLRITRIRLVTIPNLNYNGTCDPWFVITNNASKHTQELEPGRTISKQDGCIDFLLDMVVQDDVRVIFFSKSVLDKKQKMFQFWFNTSFFDPSGTLIIDKFMLDGPVKDKNHKKFSANFRVELEGTALTHPSLKQHLMDSEYLPQKQNGPYFQQNTPENSQIQFNEYVQENRQYQDQL